MPKRGKTYVKTIFDDCFLYLYMILLKRHFPFLRWKHIHWFCLSNICFVSSKKWRNFASESISLSRCFCWIMYYYALVYCFTTYSFSKIHRHISTCIHDWRFKDKGDIVKLNQFEKEIKIDRTIIRDKSCIILLILFFVTQFQKKNSNCFRKHLPKAIS